MSDISITQSVSCMPLSLRPWWAQRVAVSQPLPSQPTGITRQSPAPSYLETTYEPGPGGSRSSIPAAPPPASRSAEDEDVNESVNVTSRPVPGQPVLTVSGWPRRREGRLGHLSLEPPPARSETSRWAAATPPPFSGREQVGDDEALPYSIDLVR